MFASKFLLIFLVCVAFAIGHPMESAEDGDEAMGETKHGKSARKMVKNHLPKDEFKQAFSPLVPLNLRRRNSSVALIRWRSKICILVTFLSSLV
ncbi:hypothetical protein niasHT_022034 [Heterodera trifolii]|uniref:Uncharacterized protein n=1 Tax=Heterodera trifolii TaxID=157864 RepID=A0ABD2JBH1_9BILA